MFWQNLEIFWPEKSDFDLYKEFLTQKMQKIWQILKKKKKKKKRYSKIW
jgi:hypothetical protein